jgi:hypothetical protein
MECEVVGYVCPVSVGPRGVESLARWGVRRSPILCRCAAYLAALCVAAPFVYHLARGSAAYLGLFEDDYFYYSMVADKLAALGKLTFDETTLTNGFHPLWFLVLLVLRLVAGGLNGVFYVLLAILFLVSMVATYELSRAYASSLGASRALAPAVALVHCVATDALLASGMETAVDVPLLLWFLLEVSRPDPLTPRRAAKLGGVASLAVLARLDIALAVAMLAVAWLVLARPTLEKAWRAVLSFCAAGVAVPLYGAFNLLAFGSVLPMSALAKQLVKRRGINLPYAYCAAFSTPYGRLNGLTLALGVGALIVLWRRLSQGQEAPRAEALVAGGLGLAFTAIFFVINTLSGWVFFAWYAYPIAAAQVSALTFIGIVVAPWIAAAWRARVTAGLAAVAAGLAVFQGLEYFVTRGPLWSVEDNGLLTMSITLAKEMQGRDGVFGMGAVGGFAAYMLQRPLVQLEGLVADRAMIEHVRHEDDLRPVLRDYHVDYLVVTLATVSLEKRDGCYTITQPNAEWAGRRTAKMRGDICAEPIAHFATRLPRHPWSAFSSLDTYVFDVRDARWRSSPGG